MNKTWTSLARRESVEYKRGLKEFIQNCMPLVNTQGYIKCLCNKCLNVTSQKLEVVETQIVRYGFDQSYDVLVHHGECLQQDQPDLSRTEFEMINNEMTNMMADLDEEGCYGPEGSNELHGYYKDVYEDMNTKLYEEISSFSSMDFLIKLMNLKVSHKWTNRSFTELLKLLKLAFPSIKLVSPHYESNKLLASLGLGYENIHVCKYDCALFYKEHARNDTCPICGESRWWHISGNDSEINVLHKVVRYFPIIPRMERLFATEEIAKLMRWHGSGHRTNVEVMTHLRDGEAWREFDIRHPEFSSEVRNVRLELADDGVNPFGDMSHSYSMWTVILTVYNLLPWLIMKSEYLTAELSVFQSQCMPLGVNNMYLFPRRRISRRSFTSSTTVQR